MLKTTYSNNTLYITELDYDHKIIKLIQKTYLFLRKMKILAFPMKLTRTKGANK